MKHHEKADQVEVDMTLDKAKAADFDAMLLPGGVLNADTLRVEKGARAFAQEMEEAGKTHCCNLSWLVAAGIGGPGERAYPDWLSHYSR